MTKPSFVPTTATSRGVSACATADGTSRATSSVTSAIRAAMPGLYGRLFRWDLAKPEPRADQHDAGENCNPELQARERQGRDACSLLCRCNDPACSTLLCGGCDLAGLLARPSGGRLSPRAGRRR